MEKMGSMKSLWLIFGFIFLLNIVPEAFALCVLPPFAHLRKAPTAEAEVDVEAIPYTPLKKIAKKNGWYEVKDVDNKTHWVREDLVTTSFHCVVIKVEFANLRKGPGIRFPKAKAGMGEKYLAFRLLEEKKDWLHVEDSEGDEVWIQKDNVWRE
jgi:SH3-like domain-containing protein